MNPFVVEFVSYGCGMWCNDCHLWQKIIWSSPAPISDILRQNINAILDIGKRASGWVHMNYLTPLYGAADISGIQIDGVGSVTFDLGDLARYQDPVTEILNKIVPWLKNAKKVPQLGFSTSFHDVKMLEPTLQIYLWIIQEIAEKLITLAIAPPSVLLALSFNDAEISDVRSADDIITKLVIPFINHDGERFKKDLVINNKQFPGLLHIPQIESSSESCIAQRLTFFPNNLKTGDNMLPLQISIRVIGRWDKKNTFCNVETTMRRIHEWHMGAMVYNGTRWPKIHIWHAPDNIHDARLLLRDGELGWLQQQPDIKQGLLTLMKSRLI